MDNLISDDSDDYCFVLYDRDTVWDSVAKIMRQLISSGQPLLFDSKKRMETSMELIAVSLSMPVEDHEIMTFAIKKYEEWVDNPNLLGDRDTSNYYLRKIIRHISQPFTFKKSEQGIPNHFFQLIQRIFVMFTKLATAHGTKLNDETWDLLTKVSILAADPIFALEQQQPDLKDIARQAYDNALVVTIASGSKSEVHWKLISDCCTMWSASPTFLEAFTHQVQQVYELYNHQVLGVNIHYENIAFGVFNGIEGGMPCEHTTWLLQKILTLVDPEESVPVQKDLYERLAKIIDSVTSIATKTAKAISEKAFFRFQYPIQPFYDLFGRFFFFPANTSPEFDTITSSMLDTTTTVLANFECDGTEPAVQKLQTFLISRLDRQPHIESYARLCCRLFRKKCFLQKTLINATYKTLNNLISTSNNYAIPILYSIFEIDQSLDSSQHLKHVLDDHPSRLLTYCLAHANNQFPMKQLEKDFTKEMKPNVMASLLYFIASSVRDKPSLIPYFPSKIIQKITSAKAEPSVISATSFIITEFLNWRSDLLKKDTAVQDIFRFYHTVAEPSNLLKRTMCRLAFPQAPYDFMTKKWGSYKEINESIYLSGFKSPIIHYYTVSNCLLVSFIEEKTGQGKLIYLARGPFGKAAYEVIDDNRGSNPFPQEGSIEHKPIDPAKPIPITKTDLIGIQSSFESLSNETVEKYDDQIRSSNQGEFTTWQDWLKYGFYEELKENHEYKRPRVVDFLEMTGAVDIFNESKVRIIKDKKLAQQVIAELDALDTLKPIVIPIRHVLPCDTTMHYNETKAQRMTPIFLNFLRSLGEPIDFSDCKEIPKLRTNAPARPFLNTMAVFLTSALGATVTESEEIDSLYSKSNVKIVFNESGFNLHQSPKKGTVLYVTPLPDGLYHIHQYCSTKGMNSPFSSDVVMTAESFVFGVLLCLSQLAPKLGETFTNDIVDMKKKEIEKLFHGEEPLKELATLIPSDLKEQ